MQHKLRRQISLFAVTGRAKEEKDIENPPFDESKMEKAMATLESEAGNMNEDDPRQAANLMRKLTDMTGMRLGKGMEEALNRMEAGEDPEKVEAEMGDALEKEDPFVMPDKKGKAEKRPAPKRDETLYEM